MNYAQEHNYYYFVVLDRQWRFALRLSEVVVFIVCCWHDWNDQPAGLPASCFALFQTIHHIASKCLDFFLWNMLAKYMLMPPQCLWYKTKFIGTFTIPLELGTHPKLGLNYCHPHCQSAIPNYLQLHQWAMPSPLFYLCTYYALVRVNFMCQFYYGPRGAHISGQTLCWMFLWDVLLAVFSI